MTKDEAIKYLQQIYPNGGHCWLDEQRKEAIDMAVKALQEEPVGSIWHDASEKSNEPEDVVIINPSDNTGEVLTRCTDVYQGRIWAYTSVLLKFDNPCNIGKNLQEEPVSKDKFTFTSLPRLLDRIKPTDRAKWYSSRLADALEKEGYITDAKIVRESIKLMNGEKVPMATMDEEPVSEDLEEASKEWLKPQLDKSYANYGEAKMMELTHFDGYAMLDAIDFGANWQKQHFEKNRLAACDRQTEEEAEREQDFVMGIIECEHRQPTFDDAIKYGMRLQRENMMNGAIEVEVKEDAGGYPYIEPDIELYDYDKDAPTAKAGDKVKLIIIQED